MPSAISVALTTRSICLPSARSRCGAKILSAKSAPAKTKITRTSTPRSSSGQCFTQRLIQGRERLLLRASVGLLGVAEQRAQTLPIDARMLRDEGRELRLAAVY